LARAMSSLILKRASASRSSGDWNDDDFDVLGDGAVVGRIFKVHAAPVGTPWMWTLAFGQHEDRTPTHGYRGANVCSCRRVEIQIDYIYDQVSQDWRYDCQKCQRRRIDLPWHAVAWPIVSWTL
jgi:hypothetical protein